MGGRIVSEATLASRLNAARNAIGDNGKDQRLIRTFLRKGVRFVGDVREHYEYEPARPAAKQGSVLSDKPSIAVLPFQNMSCDPEQEYFADGVVEEIITALSRFPSLFVIARNSSFTYKGRTVGVRQIALELGVRYLLEGSVRRDGERVRITAQLISAGSSAHLWADRFDGELQDIFGLQDKVTASVVGAITPKLELAEIDRARRKPTESLDAYDYYLRGKASFHQWTKEAVADALGLFRCSITADPEFAPAYGMAAMCYALRKMNAWMLDGQQETLEAVRLAERAAALGKQDAVALSGAGYALGRIIGDIEAGVALLDQALSLNPNLAQAWYCSGYVHIFGGEPDMGLERIEHAMRLSPIDPLMFLMQTGSGLAHLIAGRYEEASSWAARALREWPDYHPAIRVFAASTALAGRDTDAAKAMKHLRRLNPALSLANIGDLLPFRRARDLSRYQEGLRKAGLPD